MAATRKAPRKAKRSKAKAALKKKPPGRAAPQIDHLFVATRDFVGSWKFWTEVMGLEGQSKWGNPEYAGTIKVGSASITIAQGEEGFYEELGYTTQAGKPQLYLRTRDLARTVALVRARGGKVLRAPLTTHYGARVASIEGPDGMVVALVEST